MINNMKLMKTSLAMLVMIAMFSPAVFAQNHRGNGRGNYGGGHGSRQYYHHGAWNRNGWYGWGVVAPIYSDGVLVSSLPPGYTSVVVAGNPYFYGNGMYFRQMPAGGFAVVTL